MGYAIATLHYWEIDNKNDSDIKQFIEKSLQDIKRAENNAEDKKATR